MNKLTIKAFAVKQAIYVFVVVQIYMHMYTIKMKKREILRINFHAYV